MMDKNDYLRFVKKIKYGDGCWDWIAGCTGSGYGVFILKGKQIYSHRLMWMLVNQKDIPGNMEVCHKCDNPKCVNPNHLFLATHYINMQDMNSKGRVRFVRGERSHLSKLTSKDVTKIKKLWSDKTIKYGQKMKFCEDTASRYDVTARTVYLIINNKRWKHII